MRGVLLTLEIQCEPPVSLARPAGDFHFIQRYGVDERVVKSVQAVSVVFLSTRNPGRILTGYEGGNKGMFTGA